MPDPRVPGLPFDDEALEQIQRYLTLTRGTGFHFGVVELEGDGEINTLLSWLAATRPGEPVGRFDLGPHVHNPWVGWRAWFVEHGSAEMIGVVTGIETSQGIDADDPPLIRALNVQRDLFVRDLPARWLLVVHPAVAMKVRMGAPDLVDFAGLWLSRSPDLAVARPGNDLPQRTVATVIELGPAHRTPGPADWPEPVRRAWDMADTGDPRGALDLLDAVDARGGHPAVDLIRGRLAPVAERSRWLVRAADADDLPTRVLARLTLADLTLNLGETSTAEAWLESAERDAQSTPWLAGECARHRARRLRYLGLHEDAIRHLEHVAIPTLAAANDAGRASAASIQLAEYAIERGALDVADRALAGLPDDLPAGLARAWLRFKRNKDTVSTFAALAERAHAAEAAAHESDALHGLAVSLRSKGRLEDALKILEERLTPLARSRRDVVMEITARSEAASIHHLLGDPQTALHILRDEVIPFRERSGQRREFGATLVRMARACLSLGRPAEAEAAALRAIELLDSVGAKQDQARAWDALGEVWLYQGRVDEALVIFKDRVRPVLRDVPDGDALAALHIAEALLAGGDVQAAVDAFLTDALPALERNGAPIGLIRGRQDAARALLARDGPGDRAKARRLWMAARDLAEELGLPSARVLRAEVSALRR